VPVPRWTELTCALLLVALGLLAPVQAWGRWMATERALRLDRPLPALATGPVLVVGVAVVGVLLLVGLVLG